MMKVIPVIDIQAGQVVAARGGQRADYQPLQTPLADSSEPIAVIDGLRVLYRFDTIYVADLDAICGHMPQFDLIETLLQHYPELDFWLDAGGRDGEPNHDRLRPVIGSENCADSETLTRIATRPRALLSIDFRDHALLGDQKIMQQSTQWPDDIIVMTLDRVGINVGPDIERLCQLQQLAPDRRFYAAGGVRHDADLERLTKLNIAGALVATALHSQTITSFRKVI